MLTTGATGAIPLFKRAIGFDPNFAIAYAWLGRAYRDLDENATAADYTQKAYELRGPTSEAEKYFILASYDIVTTGNLLKAKQTCELWIQAKLNRLDEAKATYRQALERKLDHPYLHADCYAEVIPAKHRTDSRILERNESRTLGSVAGHISHSPRLGGRWKNLRTTVTI